MRDKLFVLSIKCRCLVNRKVFYPYSVTSYQLSVHKEKCSASQCSYAKSGLPDFCSKKKKLLPGGGVPTVMSDTVCAGSHRPETLTDQHTKNCGMFKFKFLHHQNFKTNHAFKPKGSRREYSSETISAIIELKNSGQSHNEIAHHFKIPKCSVTTILHRQARQSEHPLQPCKGPGRPP